jgi:hypothetical protein
MAFATSVAIACGLATVAPAYASSDHCSRLFVQSCGTVSGNPSSNSFHGVLTFRGRHGAVIEAGRHSDGGGGAGCSDCVWTLVLACPSNGPGDAGSGAACAGAFAAP